jgi:hypothetical protein
MTTFTLKSTVLALAAIATAASSADAGAQGYAVQPQSTQTQQAQTQQAQTQQAPTDIRDFKFVNTRNSVIQGAWIAIARPNTPWVRINLSSPIGPNGVREIGMSGWRGSQCFFDLKVAFDDGTIARWNNVNLCRVTNLET